MAAGWSSQYHALRAKVKLAGYATAIVTALVDALKIGSFASKVDGKAVRAQIARDRKAYRDEWFAHDSGNRVNPARFFEALQ